MPSTGTVTIVWLSYHNRLCRCHPGITAAAVGCEINLCIQGICILFNSTLTPIPIKQSLKIVWSRTKIFSIKEHGTPLSSWIISLPNIKRSHRRHPTLTSTHRFAEPRNCKLKERLAVIFGKIVRCLTPKHIMAEKMKIITVIDIIIMEKMTFFKYHRLIDS